MLVLTCHVGGMLRIGRDIRIALGERQGDQLLVSVTAPVDTRLALDASPLQPLTRFGGTAAYLFALPDSRWFRVGTMEVVVRVPPLVGDYADVIHVGVSGPGPLRIGYEHASEGDTPIVTCHPQAIARVLH